MNLYWLIPVGLGLLLLLWLVRRKPAAQKTAPLCATVCGHVLPQEGTEYWTIEMHGKVFNPEIEAGKGYPYCGKCIVTHAIPCPLCPTPILPGNEVVLRHVPYGTPVPDGAVLYSHSPTFFIACSNHKSGDEHAETRVRSTWEIGPNELAYANIKQETAAPT